MRRSLLILNALFFVAVSVYSQSVTEIRCIKTTAIDVCEKYMNVMSNLYNGDVYNEDKFLVLFDENATIYNDILPDNQPQSLSPKDYFDKFFQNIKISYTDYGNIQFAFPTNNANDKWEIKCSFVKAIRLKSHIDKYFPKWSFKYTITIEMDKQYNSIDKIYNNAKIVKVDVEKPLNEFFIIENRDNMPIVLTSTTDIIQDWDENYKNRLFSEDDFNIDDFDILLSIDKLNYFYRLDKKWAQNDSDKFSYYPEYKFRRINFYGFNLSYSPISLGNKISNNNLVGFNDIKQFNNSMSFSFFFGAQIAHYKRSTFFLNIGLEADWSHFKYSGSNYSEYLSIDADGDPYLRIIKINSLNEKVNNYSISVPLSLEHLVQISNYAKKPMFLCFKIGGFGEYSIYLNNKYDLNVDYHGLYDYFGGVEFDHYYDYGNFNLKGNQVLLDIRNIRNDYTNNSLHYDYGLLGGTGLWISMNDINFLKFDISYKYGFKPLLDYKENYIISENFKSFQSILYSTKEGLRNIYFGVSWIVTINTKSN